MKLTKIVGAGILGLTLVGAGYIYGSYKGLNEGRKFEKKELIMLLNNERYDANQNAKFAGSMKKQEQILEIAGDITGTFEILDRTGYFNDITDKFYQEKIK